MDNPRRNRFIGSLMILLLTLLRLEAAPIPTIEDELKSILEPTETFNEEEDDANIWYENGKRINPEEDGKLQEMDENYRIFHQKMMQSLLEQGSKVGQLIGKEFSEKVDSSLDNFNDKLQRLLDGINIMFTVHGNNILKQMQGFADKIKNLKDSVGKTDEGETDSYEKHFLETNPNLYPLVRGDKFGESTEEEVALSNSSDNQELENLNEFLDPVSNVQTVHMKRNEDDFDMLSQLETATQLGEDDDYPLIKSQPSSDVIFDFMKPLEKEMDEKSEDDEEPLPQLSSQEMSLQNL